ncbi:MAG: hypothetical protein ABI969_07455 [bacterium]
MTLPPPDAFDGHAADSGEPHGPFTREHPLTFIVPEPLLLRIERLDRPGAAPGDQPVAFTRAGPKHVLLAINAYPAQLVDAFLASDAFGEPVIVVGAAWDEDGGVRGELSALLPERAMQDIQQSVSPEEERGDDEREPWADSATLRGSSYEDSVDDDDEEDDEAEPHFPLVIGAVIRFPENRKFPNDFELEVDDLMRSILEGRAMDASEKRIENLLGGI